MKHIAYVVFTTLMFAVAHHSYSQPGAQNNSKYDLTRDPVLYTVGYAHLDTEWRWDYEETINKFIKATLDENFLLFEKYKPYVFTFSGARRYKMMREYYPDKYEKLKKYIEQNRWFVGGSSVDECDANIPSPESIIRHVLYGNSFFRTEFGKTSVDFLLPDCFGFQAHLPSALAHAGITGFSTQKLEWGSAIGIPFNVGNWVGPDGKGVVAALNATDYGGNIEQRLDTVKYWTDRVMDNGRKYGVYADYRYYGVGDVGGAPLEKDVKNAVASLNNPDRKINVYLTSSDQLFRDLTPGEKKSLPSYSGDLLLTQHSAGSLTSEAYMKRWNRKNELLAQATEPMAVAADWLGGIHYPFITLGNAWWLLLGSQMHDILPGTCIPKAYEYAWNDEVLALNQFAAVMTSSIGVVIRGMDTQVKGKAVVVYNPLAVDREDVVEADIPYPEGAPAAITVAGPDGKTVPFQVLNHTKTSMDIIFTARVPSLGLTCFDVQPLKTEAAQANQLIAGRNFLENTFYKLTLNAAGDIISIVDKKLNKELLSAPVQLVFQKEYPEYWPAWNMDWNDRKNPPIATVAGPATITLTEKGPVRATFRIERTARNSSFIQTISLASGDAGNHIDIWNQVAWQSSGVSLKASFPLSASNSKATYNLGLGTIERPNNEPKKYEVPSREWFDLTDKSGAYGVTIIEDSKFGSDKPNDKTLRLTLLYTPKTNFYHDQATQDWGIHEFRYGIYSHKGDWRAGKSEWQGRALNQPLRPFLADAHPGFLGKTFSFLQVSTPQVDVRALKKAENDKEYLVRVQELFGTGVKGVEASFPGKVTAAFEVDGQEKKLGEASILNGKLVFDMDPFAIRSFTVTIEGPPQRMMEVAGTPWTIPLNVDVMSPDKDKKNGKFEENGYGLPAELIPVRFMTDGLPFVFAGKTSNEVNAVTCQGQKITFPKVGRFNRIYILAAADRDTTVTFRFGNTKKTVRIQGYSGDIGQFDKRDWDQLGRLNGLEKGYIKRDEVAFYVTHLHKDTVNVPYKYGYIYKYDFDFTPGEALIELPQNPAVKIFSISLADNPYDKITPLAPLYDDFSGRPALALKLPKSYVSDAMKPMAKVSLFRRRNLNDLPYKVDMKDYADLRMPNGVACKYYNYAVDNSKSMRAENGFVLPALTDGMFDLLPGDTVNDVWFDSGEARIIMDMQRQTQIDSLHLFMNLSPRRGPMAFSLWGLEDGKAFTSSGDPVKNGWTFVAYAPPPDIWGESKGVYSIVLDKGTAARFRYLMWINDNTGQGPYYFREIDVYEKQK